MRLVRPFLAVFLFLFLTAWSWAQDGKMYVVYAPAKTPFGKTMESALKSSGGLEEICAAFTKLFKLPRDLPLILAESGQVNCWYDESKHRVVVSYEFMEFLLKLFQKHNKNTEEAATDMAGTLIFTLFHELGHAFIGEMDIPTTGREEDAADEFAVLLLNHMGKDGQSYALSAAKWFIYMADRPSNKDLPFWDEHSLDEQRYFAIFSMLYGSDPNRFMFVEKLVPQTRLAKASAEYKKKENSWQKLLAPCYRGDGRL